MLPTVAGSDCVRNSDTISRQGGDEFVVLLSEMEHSEDAAISAIKMLQAVAEAHSIDQHDLHVTASIGVSVYPDDGLDAETLIKNADTAMYQAKENGRHSYQFFRPARMSGPWSGNPSRRIYGAPWSGRNYRCITSRKSI